MIAFMSTAVFSVGFAIFIIITAWWWLRLVIPLYIATLPAMIAVYVVWLVVAIPGYILFWWYPPINDNLEAFAKKLDGWTWDYIVMIIKTPYYVFMFLGDIFAMLAGGSPAGGYYWFTFMNT